MSREESKQSEVSGQGGEPTDQTQGSSEQGETYYLVDETYILLEVYKEGVFS